MGTDAKPEKLLELPDWVQEKLNSTAKQRMKINHELIGKEQAIAKINDHLAKGTFPKSIIPNVKLHVSKQYQDSTCSFLNNLNKQYCLEILNHLKDIREKERVKLLADQGELFKNLQINLKDSLLQLKEAKIYDRTNEQLNEDYLNFVKIYKMETRNIERETRIFHFMKDKKLKEQKQAKAAEIAQSEADVAMSDPLQDLRLELKDIKNSIKNIRDCPKNSRRTDSPKHTHKKPNRNPGIKRQHQVSPKKNIRQGKGKGPAESNTKGPMKRKHARKQGRGKENHGQ